MSFESHSPKPDMASSHSVVTEIYRGLPTPDDKKIIETKKNEIIKSSDIGGVTLYKELRQHLSELDTD